MLATVFPTSATAGDATLAAVLLGLAGVVLLVVLVPPWRSVRRERRLRADETTRLLAGDDETAD